MQPAPGEDVGGARPAHAAALPIGPAEQPWHSSQYPSLPEVFVQNASLEIAWSRVVFEGRTIAGTVLMPFFTRDAEGFDVNKPYDWDLAEHMVQQKTGQLPPVLKDNCMTQLDF